MAFPTGYTKYQEITIDHTKVPGDLTDFIVYVSLADLVKAGADIFDLCRSDGGDIRATKSDGTTQLATELVVIDTTAKTGELHIKYTGTLSSTTDTVIRIYYNGSDTALSTSDTYGRNAVWSAYVAVWHMQEASGDITSSTGNNTGVDGNTVGTGTGKLQKGRDFITTNSEQFSIASGSQTGLGITGNAITMSVWSYGDSALNNLIKRIIWRLGGTGSYGYQLSTSGNVYGINNAYVISAVGTGGGTDYAFGTAGDATSSAFKHVVATYDGTNFRGYVNATKQTSGTLSNRLTNANAISYYIGSSGAGDYYDGILDEVRMKATVNSDNWITTEYNNQNSPSTFYAVGDEVGGGSAYTQDVEETLTVTDTIRRDTGKQIEETLTVTETVQKAISTAKSEAITITDAGARLLVKLASIVDGLTVTDSLTRAMTKTMTEVATITETLRKDIARELNESITITDLVAAATATYTKLISEVVTITDAFSRTVGYVRNFTETVNITEYFISRLNGINSAWSELYTNTADEWSDIYHDN